MPLEPTPERQLTPDEEPESEAVVIHTDCCDLMMFKHDATRVNRIDKLGVYYYCDECLIEFKDEIKLCN